MKRILNITKIVFALIAIVFVILISRIVPKDQFEPYRLQLDSLWEKENNQQEYLIDINNDQAPEKIRHHNINSAGHSIELIEGENLTQIHFFKENAKFIGNNFTFADIQGDSNKELLFISVIDTTAYLNILACESDIPVPRPIRRVEIDSVQQHNEKIDVINNFLIASDPGIYFDLQGGYTLQPRNIYKYNFKHDQLTKTKLNSLVTPLAESFNHKGQNFLLATHVKANGNTISPEEAAMLRKSTNKDTMAIYQDVKNLEYEYGDFSSYILLYDDSLRFVFEPIEFYGWTNFTKTTLVPIEGLPYIFSFTNALLNEPDNKRSKQITVCDLQGEIIRQMPLPHNYSDIFSGNGRVIFYGEKTLYINNNDLELLHEIKGITHATGFIDILEDNKPEFMAFRNNVLTVFSENFDINATFKIDQEFAPYPEEHGITTLQINNRKCLLYNSRLFYYLFSYQKNNWAFLKFPFYIAVFLFSFGILLLVSRFNTRRLEKENIKLEQIVDERTKEISMQKEEIATQADDLERKNKNLLELGKFKKLMTDTVIHDLKNPLNNIIRNTNDKSIRQSGYNMMNIVLNILDINKAQTTKLNVSCEKQNMAELIESAIQQVEFLCEEKNLTFEKIIQKNYHVSADKDLTIRILVNLLTNAIKFSPLNSKITIQAAENGRFVQVDVTDYGKGIPEGDIKMIFNEYAQIEARKSGKMQSTGIGLTFCKIATEAQKARISVSSVPGVKTSFSLLFPIVAVSEKKAEAVEPVKAEILLGESDRKLLQDILPALKQTKIFEATDILKLLNTVEDASENMKRWKQKLKTAMYASNTELFYKMIDDELQNTDH